MQFQGVLVIIHKIEILVSFDKTNKLTDVTVNEFNLRAHAPFYADSHFDDGWPVTVPAVIGIGKTCELRCEGAHDENGRPKQFRLSGEGRGLKIINIIIKNF